MRFRLYALLGAALAAGVAVADPVSKVVPEPPPAAARPDRPTSVDDLKAIQTQVRAVTDHVIPVTVGLQVGAASGSGVIVSPDGLIMTAGHVIAGPPGRELTVVMADGKRHKGKVLGFDPKIDSGMAILTDKPEGGKWPYAEVAPSREVKGGQWVIATGQPGGVKKGRPPVVRVGRIITPTYKQPNGVSFLQTDCILVGGDSGGPLWDMKGRLIGIHSRIGFSVDERANTTNSINENMAVPTDRFKEAWDKLTTETVIGVIPYLGVTMADDATECKVNAVTRNAPAAQAGMKAGDIITRFAGQEVGSYDEFLKALKEQKPYAQVDVDVKRGDEVKTLKVSVGYKFEE